MCGPLPHCTQGRQAERDPLSYLCPRQPHPGLPSLNPEERYLLDQMIQAREQNARMILTQTKNAQVVCILRRQMARTRAAHFLKSLSEEAIVNRLYTLQNKQAPEDKKAEDVYSRCPFILIVALE